MADSDDEEGKRCLNCGASFEGLRRCGKCKAVYFCNAACQREVWKEHCKTCVAPAGAAPPPPPEAPGQGAASGAPAAAGAPPAAPEQKYTPEQIKREGLRRVNQEVLPEVGALMREGKFADAIEHLEESVAFASGADERELLDALSCLTARCYLGMGRPKEALQGLNPALMQARRNGGPSAIKPHSIAAECFRALGDEEKTRVELRALVEAAAESADEAEQAGALLLAGIALFDMGDLHAAVPLLASAAAAAEKVGDSRGAPPRAGAPAPRCSGCGARAKPRRRGGTSSRRSRRASAGKRNERKRRDKRFLSAMAAPTHALMARMSSPRRRVSRRRSASAPERRRRRSGPRRPRRASLKIHKKTERRKAFAPWRPSATRALGGAARTATSSPHTCSWARARRPRRTSRTPVRSRGRSARRRRRRPGCARGTRATGGRRLRRRPRRRARGVRKGRRRRAGRGARRARGARQERRGGQSGSRGDDRRRVEREARLNRRGGARTVRFDVKFRWSLRTRNVESISPARARGRHSIMRPPVRPPPSVLIRRQGGQSGRRCVERAVGARGVFARFPPRGSRHTTCADV